MKTKSILAGVLALSVLCLGARDASAQVSEPPSEQPAAYRNLVEQGLTEYAARHFAEARSLFSRAVEVYPSARALRGLGMAEFELRNYGDSAVNLRRALDSEVESLDPPLRKQTQQLLTRANSFVARVQVAIEPSAAAVVVDGIPVQLGQQGNLVLEVGDHVIEFRADGYEPEKRMLKVKGGEDQALRIALPPATSSYGEGAHASALSPVAQKQQKRWFIVPRLTLLLPSAMRRKSALTCAVGCEEFPAETAKQDRNTGLLLGGEVLFSPLPRLRLGLGVHVQLNQIKQKTREGFERELGRALWVPLVGEYHVPVSPRVTIPLRGMLGFAMLTGGKALDAAEASYRSACDAVARDGYDVKCNIKGSPALGFVMGVGPGVTLAVSEAVALRTDVTLGYQRFRESKLDTGSVKHEAHASGLLAAWSLGVEL